MAKSNGRRRVDKELTSRIVELREDPLASSLRTFGDIGEILGISKDRAQKLYRMHVDGATHKPFPNPPRKPIPDPELAIQGDIAVTGDIHVSSTDWDLLQKFMIASRLHGIKKAAIVGDLFNFDVFSHFDKTGREDSMATELESARSIIRFMATWFDEIYVCRGNHDERWMKTSSGQVDMTTLGDLIAPDGHRKKIVTTQRNYIYVDTPTGRWMLVHPIAYRRNKLAVAKTISSRHQCHVVSFHEHFCAVGMSDDGRFTIANCGCMADPEITPYVQNTITDMPAWNLGFGLIVKGYWIPYVKDGHWGLRF